MSRRDRLAIAGIVALAVLGFGWLEVVSPERSKVTTANTKVEAARQQLQSAQSELSQARSAQARYAEAYASIVRLGKAVPAGEEVPALVYEVDQASNQRHVDFTSVTTSSAGGSSSAAKASGPPTTFTQMPFTFVFNGSYADLYHLVSTLQGLDVYSSTSGVAVNGRLLSVQSVDLVPAVETAGAATTAGQSSKPKATPGEHLTGTITATAYVLPPSQSLPSAPGASAGGTPGSSTSGSGTSAGSPATIKALP